MVNREDPERAGAGDELRSALAQQFVPVADHQGRHWDEGGHRNPGGEGQHLAQGLAVRLATVGRGERREDVFEAFAEHVEHADQVVSVNEDVFVKLIDIDLERRRISLSLKQALDEVDPDGSDFNPVLYGMSADYDEKGQYRYPEGFDPATSEWKDGFEEARTKWEAEYAEAHARWETHKVQAKAAFEHLAALPDTAPAQEATASSGEAADQGTLADDASLAALRDKLSEDK